MSYNTYSMNRSFSNFDEFFKNYRKMIEQYLNTLSYCSSTFFVDDYSPNINPDYVLTVEGNNMSPIVIQAFRKAENEFIINSSLNPRSFFKSEKSDLFSKIFIGKKELFMQTGK